MEETALALVLKDCLQAMEQGGELAIIVEKYPAERADILPMLEVAVRLRGTAGPAPLSADFLRRLGRRLHDVGTATSTTV